MKLSFTKSEVKFFAESLKKETIANTFYQLECTHIANILNMDNVVVLENFFNFITEKKDAKIKGKIARATKDMYSELKLAVNDKKKQQKICRKKRCLVWQSRSNDCCTSRKRTRYVGKYIRPQKT